MGKLATVIEAPIKGALGDDINVGDVVMVVTTGYSHRVNVMQGVYMGYIESKGYYTQRARVEILDYQTVMMKEDGTEFNWNTDYNASTWEEDRKKITYKKVPYMRKSTLNRNRIATITAAEAKMVDKIGSVI